MASNEIGVGAPLGKRSTEPTTDNYFTDAQWTTLMAIMDTVIPSVHRETTTSYQLSQLTISNETFSDAVEHLKANVVDPPSLELLDSYLGERPSENPDFQALFKRTLLDYSREDARKGLAIVLSALK